jgi:cardiolipin synthase C
VATPVEVAQLGHVWRGGAANQPFSDEQGPDASRMAWAFCGKAVSRLTVRVRLLIDDLYTGKQHEAHAGLANYERVEVRVFNPFAVRGGGLMQRFISSLDDFGRLQMRMHNKLLIADGAFAITGGRNVADEYYWQSEDSAFFDLDALIAGPVVADMAGLFDLYWNSERVWPIVVLSRPERDLDKRRSRFDAFVAAARLPAAPTLSVDLLGYGRLGDEIGRGQVRLHTGRAQAVADAPTKVLSQQSDEDGELWAARSEIRRVINGVMRAAESETTIITPYFVPGKVGVARTKANHERGVRIRILTNSLASTDEPVVHTGYRRYRKAMLRAGAELYEIDAQPSARLALTEMRGRPVLRIHTKAGIVDRRIVYR